MSDDYGGPDYGPRVPSVIREAHRRFKRCQDWERTARERFVADVKFASGDSDNGYQWDENILRGRAGIAGQGAKPCLTINKTRQHCLQVVNDARQNKPGIEFRPVGDGATFQSAKIFEGIVRHIEYISNAQAAYDTATWFQVHGGIGYLRILTDYIEGTFDQEIYIRRVPDPLSVYLDPDIQQYDGSDARFGFVFRDMPRDDFDDTYPRYKGKFGESALGNDENGWDDEDHVRVAEYYRRVEKSDKLLNLVTGETVQQSAIPDNEREMMPNEAVRDERDVSNFEVEWYLIAGNKVLEKRKWPGKYIPLIRVVGEETIIGGELDRKGHTRALKDPQRMLNYWTSSAAEHVALQTKVPYVAPAAAIEGYETYWQTANTVNHAVLPYNAMDDAGRVLPPPRREPPPIMPQAYMQGWQQAQQELMLASGQYQAVMGQPSNETSGIAIQQRQRQGDNATYHYIDHLGQAVRLTGRQLLDLIPKVYDTERVMKIIAENGDQSDVTVSPDSPHALAEVPLPPGSPPQQDANGKLLAQQVQRIFNPSVGRYEVEADIGPAYATKRQEAFNAFMQIASQNRELVSVIGDLMFKAADFPMADEISERLHNMLPPQALGNAPNPQVQQIQAQAQQQIQGLHQVAGNLVDQLAQAKRKIAQMEGDATLKEYDAETRRMAAIGNVDPEAMKVLVRSLVSEALQTPIVPVMQAHAVADAIRSNDGGVGNMPPVPPPPQPNGADNAA